MILCITPVVVYSQWLKSYAGANRGALMNGSFKYSSLRRRRVPYSLRSLYVNTVRCDDDFMCTCRIHFSTHVCRYATVQYSGLLQFAFVIR